MHLLLALVTLVGTWQGVMDAPGVGKLPRVMTITQNHGIYDVVIHSIEESDVPIVTKNVTINGSSVTMKFDMNSDPWMDYHRIYHATLSQNGKSLTGSWEGNGVKVTMAYNRTQRVAFHLFGPKHDTYVTVDSDVKDEVLDWGGSGRPMLLLAGAGVTARGFRDLAPDLMKHYHVYSMTRRGFGNSSRPPFTTANYSATRLGKDVLAVIDALKLEKPILVGHSLAGEELSYIGDNAPEKAAALIYLDAGYYYAFDLGVATPTPPPSPPPSDAFQDAIFGGMEHFAPPTGIPILAIYAHPHALAPGEKRNDNDTFEEVVGKQIDALKAKAPTAEVLVIPNANHFVYYSNRAEVLNAMNAFIAKLPK